MGDRALLAAVLGCALTLASAGEGAAQSAPAAPDADVPDVPDLPVAPDAGGSAGPPW